MRFSFCTSLKNVYFQGNAPKPAWVCFIRSHQCHCLLFIRHYRMGGRPIAVVRPNFGIHRSLYKFKQAEPILVFIAINLVFHHHRCQQSNHDSRSQRQSYCFHLDSDPNQHPSPAKPSTFPIPNGPTTPPDSTASESHDIGLQWRLNGPISTILNRLAFCLVEN